MEGPILIWGFKEQETRLILHNDNDDDDDEDEDVLFKLVVPKRRNPLPIYAA
jgi:hypothetical protein